MPCQLHDKIFISAKFGPKKFGRKLAENSPFLAISLVPKLAKMKIFIMEMA